MRAMRAAAVLFGCAIVPAHGFGIDMFLGRGNKVGRGRHRSRSGRIPQRATSTLYGHLPVIWVEDAEADFVDEEENLEDGEVCIKSLKAFASKPVAETEEDSSEPRFLCAGALVQRPPSSQVCDAWTADSILMEGGPNLQLQGALKLLDELLLFQLRRHSDNPILALQTFVVKCGSLDSEYTCASYMAATARGFRPLRELVRINSIYTASCYDNDLDGSVLGAQEGKEIYRKLAFIEEDESVSLEDQRIASTSIYHLLPDDDTIRRLTHKRYTSPKG
jgi:hypothetical protein